MKKDYWINRTEKRLVYAEQLSFDTIEDVLDIYSLAYNNVLKRIESLYRNYSKKGILDKNSLNSALGNKGRDNFLEQVATKARELGLNPAQIYDVRYLDRLSVYQSQLELLKLEIMSTAPNNESLIKRNLDEVAQFTYSDHQKALSQRGVSTTFASLDKRGMNAILNSSWYGGNYSSRIWTNTQVLAVKLPTVLGGAIQSGQSYQKTAKQIKDLFDVSNYNATRLVRTESNYIFNQATVQSYIDSGIERYEYTAILDGRTSEICTGLDGQIYKVKDAVAGVNYPPMHPNCRSTTLEILDDDEIEGGRRKGRFQRITPISEDLEAKWKQSMQQQMNPLKEARDYNADMNILTQNLQKKSITKSEFVDKLNNLMSNVPKEYTLREGLETVAKLYGWKG